MTIWNANRSPPLNNSSILSYKFTYSLTSSIENQVISDIQISKLLSLKSVILPHTHTHKRRSGPSLVTPFIASQVSRQIILLKIDEIVSYGRTKTTSGGAFRLVLYCRITKYRVFRVKYAFCHFFSSSFLIVYIILCNTQ